MWRYRLREWLVTEVNQRRTAPQAKRISQRACPCNGVTLVPTLIDHHEESNTVYCIGVNGKHIASRCRAKNVLAEKLSQAGDVPM
jgi:hypothetical protein